MINESNLKMSYSLNYYYGESNCSKVPPWSTLEKLINKFLVSCHEDDDVINFSISIGKSDSAQPSTTYVEAVLMRDDGEYWNNL